jgi:hypothetical protein
MTLIAKEIGDAIYKKDKDTPPVFDMNKLNTLELGSDVNIKRGDSRLSSRFLAEDPIMQDYKTYLLETAAYNVQKKNEKFQEKMGTLGSIFGAMTSFATSQVTGLLKKPINSLIEKGKNFLGRNFGEHKSAFKAAEAMGLDVDYKDVRAAMNKQDGVIKVGDDSYRLVNAPDSKNFLGGRHDSRGQIYDLSDPTYDILKAYDKNDMPYAVKIPDQFKRKDYNDPATYGFSSAQKMEDAGLTEWFNKGGIEARKKFLDFENEQVGGGYDMSPKEKSDAIKASARHVTKLQNIDDLVGVEGQFVPVGADLIPINDWLKWVGLGVEGVPPEKSTVLSSGLEYAGGSQAQLNQKVAFLQKKIADQTLIKNRGPGHPAVRTLLAQRNAIAEKAGRLKMFFEENETGDGWVEDFERFASGGLVPAMLTSGEAVIPASTAKRIGYDNLDKMNRSGNLPMVEGPGGRDQVGPVGLTPGDFVIRRGSTSKLLNDNPNLMRLAMQNPDGFRKAAAGYYDGGLVGEGDMAYSRGTEPVAAQDAGTPVNRLNLLSSTDSTSSMDATGAQRNETTNNININVSIDGSGAETTVEDGDPEAQYNREKELSTKIKNAVVEVIRQEKRIGGELN